MAGGVHGRGYAWRGRAWQGDMHGRKKQQLQWAVRILLECILVSHILIYTYTTHTKQHAASYPFSSTDAGVNADANALRGQGLKMFKPVESIGI